MNFDTQISELVGVLDPLEISWRRRHMNVFHAQHVNGVLHARANVFGFQVGVIIRNDLRWREMQRQGKEGRTQAVGRLSWEAKLEGLLVPSLTRPDGVNLVFFPENRKTESSLEIINVSDLPLRP